MKIRNLSEEECQNWNIYEMLSYSFHHHPFLSHNIMTILRRSYHIPYGETEARINELINFVAIMPKASNSHISRTFFSVSVSIPISLFAFSAVASQEK